MIIDKDYLRSLLTAIGANPKSILTSTTAVKSLERILIGRWGAEPKIVGPTGPTNSLLVIELDKATWLWLSDYDSLATIMGEDKMSLQRKGEVQAILQENGWKYVPEFLAGSPVTEGRLETWFDELFGEY